VEGDGWDEVAGYFAYFGLTVQLVVGNGTEKRKTRSDGGNFLFLSTFVFSSFHEYRGGNTLVETSSHDTDI